MKKNYFEPLAEMCAADDPITMSTGSFGTGDDWVSDQTPLQ